MQVDPKVCSIRRLVDKDLRKLTRDLANEVKNVCAVNVLIATVKCSLNETVRNKVIESLHTRINIICDY